MHVAGKPSLGSSSTSKAVRKMNQSAPVNVPVLSTVMAKERMSGKEGYEVEEEEEEEEEMLPPHEIVARGSRRSPKMTLLEGFRVRDGAHGPGLRAGGELEEVGEL